MSMSLPPRGMIARPKHRAADVSVEIETQFGPATSRPDNVPKPPAGLGLGVAASDTARVSVRRQGWRTAQTGSVCCCDGRGEPSSSPDERQTQSQGERGASVLAEA